MKRNLVTVVIILLVTSGCSIQYHNEKSFTGKATKVKTRLGTIDKANAYFKSTFDMILGSMIKKQPIPPPANLDFLQ